MKFKFQILGIYFLLFQIYINYFIVSQSLRTDLFFWICNLIPFIFAIGFFTKNIELIRSLINISLFVHILWTIDFMSILIFNFHFLGGYTEYVFQKSGVIILPILVHMFSSSIALFGVFNLKFDNKKILIYSFILILFFQILSLIFTQYQNNINCVYYVCIIFKDIPYYALFYPFIYFLLLVLPIHYFQKILFKYFKN